LLLTPPLSPPHPSHYQHSCKALTFRFLFVENHALILIDFEISEFWRALEKYLVLLPRTYHESVQVHEEHYTSVSQPSLITLVFEKEKKSFLERAKQSLEEVRG
jgi:hypothetical protein